MGLYFTIGLPRSGKSTFANQWVRETWDKPRAIVGGDDFRTALHGKSYVPEAESTVFAMMDVAARALLLRGFDVMIDETCTTEATLLRYLRINREARCLWIMTPEDECIRRAIQSGKDYLIGPIRRMSQQMKVLQRNWEATHQKLLGYLDSRRKDDVTC